MGRHGGDAHARGTCQRTGAKEQQSQACCLGRAARLECKLNRHAAQSGLISFLRLLRQQRVSPLAVLNPYSVKRYILSTECDTCEQHHIVRGPPTPHVPKHAARRASRPRASAGRTEPPPGACKLARRACQCQAGLRAAAAGDTGGRRRAAPPEGTAQLGSHQLRWQFKLARGRERGANPGRRLLLKRHASGGAPVAAVRTSTCRPGGDSQHRLTNQSTSTWQCMAQVADDGWSILMKLRSIKFRFISAESHGLPT